MTTNKSNTAKSIVAAALAAALAAGTTVAQALTATATVPNQAPIVAQSCTSDWAVDAAVVASPVGWGDVSSVDWHYEADSDDYVVNVTSWWGD